MQNDFHQWLFDSFRAHQIRFRPGLRLEPHWGSLQRSPRPLAGFRGPTSKGEGDGRYPPALSQIAGFALGLSVPPAGLATVVKKLGVSAPPQGVPEHVTAEDRDNEGVEGTRMGNIPSWSNRGSRSVESFAALSAAEPQSELDLVHFFASKYGGRWERFRETD